MAKSEEWRSERRDDFTLFEILNVLWGRRLLVGGVVLTMVLFSTLFGLLYPRPYVAEAIMTVRPEDNLGVDEDSELMIQRILNSVDASELARGAMREAGWTAGPEEFRERLDVEPDESDAGGIRVRFSAATPEEATLVANAYAGSFVERAEELNRQRLAGGTLAADVRVTRPATPSEARYTGLLLYETVAAAAGLLLGGAAALILEGRTRRWRGAKDAELTLRAPVLGVIPDYHTEEERPEERVG